LIEIAIYCALWGATMGASMGVSAAVVLVGYAHWQNRNHADRLVEAFKEGQELAIQYVGDMN